MAVLNLILNIIQSKLSLYLGILTITCFAYYLFIKRNKKVYNLPPGPVGLPLVGYLPFLGPVHHLTLCKVSKKYGSVFSFYLGRTLTVAICDWSSAEKALNKSETLDRIPGLFDILPNGIGFGGANGKKWVDQRKLTVKILKELGFGRQQWSNILQEEVKDIVEIIRDSKGHDLEIRSVLSSTFTNNLLSMLLGYRPPSDYPVTILIGPLMDFIVKQYSTLASVNFFLYTCLFLQAIGLYRSRMTIQKCLDFTALTRKIVDEELDKGTDENKSFIKLYNKEVKNQTNDQNTTITLGSLYGNVNGLLMAGSESVRTSLVWLFLSVAENPDVQQKVHDEIDSVLGKDGKITWGEREKLPYTYSTILESMRYKTILPLTPLRIISADTKIHDYDIPKGTAMVINIWALHNDPKYFPEPNKFKPERFLIDGGTKVNTSKESYIPFSYGKRDCPGKLIGLMELMEYFVTIMQNFTVLLPEDGVPKYEPFLGLAYQANSMILRFKAR